MSTHRRGLLLGAAGFAVAALSGGVAKASAAGPRSLSLYNLHTGEALRATYFEYGAYVPDALQAMNHLLRDFRTGEAHPIAPGLIDLVTTLRSSVETEQTVQVISGYRSPHTNAALQELGHGVATHSLHMQGMAIDIRIPGIQLAHLRDAALALRSGGVGYYPDSDFVHVDVGRVRRW